MRKTTFVLGAGFSKLYDYPLGSELIHLISDLLWDSGPSFFDGKFDPQLLDEIKRSLLPSMEGSIDAYLQKRPQLKEIGYLSAAQILLQHENPNPKVLHRNNKFNPYRAIVSSLGDLREVPEDVINVITFNYDRTFEQFLMEHIKSRYIMNTVDAKRVFDRINYAHAYGQLGYLPWQLDPHDKSEEKRYCLDYGSARTPSTTNIMVGARRIGTVYNKIDPHQCETDMVFDKKLEKALKLYRESDNVLFLGFGYLEENMKFLGNPPTGSGKAILGSSHKLPEKTKDLIISKYGIHTEDNFNDIERLLTVHDALRYLREPYSLGV
jgi:hypothetical protein